MSATSYGESQSANGSTTAPLTAHSNVAPASETKLTMPVRPSTNSVGFCGPSMICTVGAVVSGATFQVRCAPTESRITSVPTVFTARTLSVCWPKPRFSYTDGIGQAVNGGTPGSGVSSEHSNVAFGSSLPKANVAVWLVVLPVAGPNSIVVLGSPRSAIVHVQ